ncbi:hypothetical protein N0V93_005660 [Gnomoniopsis smithogilvyi]|uniref:Uncharacterized protein n=1 Tax=Gnomoniopsis smithogilvyi TaxID=1191159 RepID=A0A9W8YX14_9PEZI|nr:hypothetical protein N0V93_005660 [Gnomoniopsis smithogilvyi]
MPLCGHPPSTLLSYASCTAVLSQLMRITEAEAWEPDSLTKTPFDLPDDCDPRPENIWTLYSDDYCGWECRNNAYLLAAAGFDDPNDFGTGAESSKVGGGLLSAHIPGDESGRCVLGRNRYLGSEEHLTKRPSVLGMPDASYGPGSERLGIGWRSM